MAWSSRTNLKGPPGDNAQIERVPGTLVSLEAGVSGSMRYSMSGDTVMVSVGLTLGGTFTLGTTTIAVGAIPENMRPQSTARGTCFFNGNVAGTVAVTNQGDIQITHDNDVARTTAQPTVTYLRNIVA